MTVRSISYFLDPTSGQLRDGQPKRSISEADIRDLFDTLIYFGVPVFANNAARDAYYPSPTGDEKGVNKSNKQFERYDSTRASWVAMSWRSVVVGCVADGTTNERARIQAELDWVNTNGGGEVFVPFAGTGVYAINASLIIYSNTTLRLDDRVTIKLLSGSNCNMIHNAAWVAGSGRDTNIKIIGGTWDRGSNAGTLQQLHTILLQRVDGLKVLDTGVNSTAGKYSICLYACTNGVVDNITFNCASDGVHLSGLCKNFKISNLYGTTGDDVCALTPIDWAAYQNGDFGDISSVEVSGVYASTGASSGRGIMISVGFVNSTRYGCRNIKARNINGAFGGCGVFVGGSNGEPATLGGYIYDVDIDQVYNIGVGDGVRIKDAGTNGYLDNITVSRVRQFDAASQVPILFDATNGATTIGNVVLRDHQWTSTVSAQPVQLQGGVVVECLTLDHVFMNPTATNYAINYSGTGTTIKTLRVKNCRLKVQSASAGFIRTLSGLSQVLGDVFIEDFIVDQCSHALGDLYTTTNFYIRGLKATTVADLVFLRATAVIDIKEAHGIVGTNTNVIGNGGAYSLTSRALEFHVDSALLAKNNGDMCYNTNAANGNGVGPCVSNGTLWKNLYTAATG